MKKNVLFAGVGGQGLVLTTKLLVDAAMDAGINVSSSDVIGLAQRGGRVFGMVRLGFDFFSPLIPKGEADVIVAMEELEGLRWMPHLKDKGIVILNKYSIYPTPVLLDKAEYPTNPEKLFIDKGHDVIEIDGIKKAKEIRNVKLANTILLGILSRELSIPEESWIKSIKDNVPSNTVDLNIEAFRLGANTDKDKDRD
jgi:indolepyruvate ferredoxin oxidoreductase beta subunit